MAKSNDYDELEYLWTMWHNSTGPAMKPYYKQYIELSNKAAKLNGFEDAGDMWRSKYEDPNFIDNLKKIWRTVEPLYKELHEYTRNKLIKIYGKLSELATLSTNYRRRRDQQIAHWRIFVRLIKTARW